MNDNDIKALGLQSQMEQVFEELVNFAVILQRYYRELIAAGFTKEQALSLVLDFQRNQFGGGKQ